MMSALATASRVHPFSSAEHPLIEGSLGAEFRRISACGPVRGGDDAEPAELPDLLTQ